MGRIAEHRAVCFFGFPAKTGIRPRFFCADKLRGSARKSHTTSHSHYASKQPKSHKKNVGVAVFNYNRPVKTDILRGSYRFRASPIPQSPVSSHIKLCNYTIYTNKLQYFLRRQKVDFFILFRYIFVICVQLPLGTIIITSFSQKSITFS